MSLGFFLDINKCTGCRTCHVACKDLHDLSVGPMLRQVRNFEVGSYPEVDGFRYATSCHHCNKATCVDACPVQAIFYGEDGTVQVDQEICLSCKLCSDACPYDAPQFDPLNEDKMIKCDSCKGIREAGENPVCVDACTMRCLAFGDMDELRTKYGLDLVNELPILPDASITEPNLLLKAKPASLRNDYKEVEI